MSEALSWREENWWERKSIPVASFSISPRQLVLLLGFGGLGDAISLPMPESLFGALYLGKIIPIIALLAIGLIVGSHRTRMIPVEFQFLLKATRNRALQAKIRLEKGETSERK
jgi:hypothetical protein